MITVRHWNPPGMAPDLGEYDNPGWLAVFNALPVGASSWIPMGSMGRKVDLTATSSDIPLGHHVHPGHGAAGWTIYYATATKLFAVDPSGWTESDVSGASYAGDTTYGWQFVAYRDHEVASGGHAQDPQIRLDGAGNFEDLIENKEPTSLGMVAAWQEDASGAPDYVELTAELNSISTGETAQPFPAGAGINDAVYFGLPAAATALRVEVETAGAGTYTVAWEFWNGFVWTALSGLSDPSSGFKTAGTHVITYTFPVDWQERSVNGSVHLFYLRAVRDGGTVTTDPVLDEADPVTGNWPPKPRYCAVWGSRMAIANIANNGPANASGLANDQYLIWVSADNNPRRYGLPLDLNHAGERTDFYYLADEHGPITALAGGADFGAVFKPRASYMVDFQSPLGLEFRLLDARVGTIWPQAMTWAGGELYYWSTAGPARMSIGGGVELLGEGIVQRAIFDDSWVGDTFPITTDRASRHRLFACYSPTLDLVSWWYRSTETMPEIGVHYHRATGRFSFSEHRALVDGANTGGQLWGVVVNPYVEDTRYEGFKDLVFFSRTTNLPNIAIYQVDPSAAAFWQHFPTWQTSWMGPGRGQSGVPVAEIVQWVRPVISLNAAPSPTPLTPPVVVVTAKARRQSALSLPDATIHSVVDNASTADEYGNYRLPDSIPALYHQIRIELGGSKDIPGLPNDLANIANFAMFHGFDYATIPADKP